jgi:catechol 2,3-dioxygenase-like lactoylglutathione lyase family enzyme
MSLRVGINQINVTDLDLAWRFYVETLGIPGRQTLGSNKAFELDLGPGPTILVYPVTQSFPRPYPDSTGVTLGFYTDDISVTVAAWRARGVEFVPIEWATDPSGIAPTPFGPFIAFRDPFANTHELLQPAG